MDELFLGGQALGGKYFDCLACQSTILGWKSEWIAVMCICHSESISGDPPPPKRVRMMIR